MPEIDRDDEARKNRLETLEAVNEALAEEGEARPAAEVHAELRTKHFGAAHRPPHRQERAKD